MPGEKRRVKRSRSHRETCGRGPRRRPGFGAGDPCLGGPAASCSCPIGHCLAPVDVISMRDSKPGTRPPVPGAPDAIASAGSRAGLRAGGQPSCLCHDESRRFWAKGRRLLRRQSPGCGRGPWPAGTPGRRVVSPPRPPPLSTPFRSSRSFWKFLLRLARPELRAGGGGCVGASGFPGLKNVYAKKHALSDICLRGGLRRLWAGGRLSHLSQPSLSWAFPAAPAQLPTGQADAHGPPGQRRPSGGKQRAPATACVARGPLGANPQTAGTVGPWCPCHRRGEHVPTAADAHRPSPPVT